ncbi:uncharacterized protein HaLaN_28254 [Haematococcus lacustris]|uniref:Uncharacterized protein n=1 Tax=Haematococcus lacustris TaxID=44745 RepID=A0A6A0A9Y7_HAELA|nr:uncharacterized protein HaLaN_28254 [Haematococcus lacustris]
MGCGAGGLLDKLRTQQQTARHLAELQQSADLALEKVSLEVAVARSQVDEARRRAQLHTQHHLDLAREQLREALAAEEAARDAHDKVLKVAADVWSGISHLASMVAAMPLPPGQLPVPVSEETLADVLAQAQLRVQAASTFINSIPKAAALLEGLVTNPDFAFVGSRAAGREGQAQQASG